MRRFSSSPLLVAAFLALAAPALADGPRNHLGADDSPYLRLHSTDAVHWRRWGVAAFAEARRLGRPVLLSLGYAACHWCHVMQRESFTDAETARLVNEHFVPILVDREERPDVDSLYQDAMRLIGRPTGWPLTVFATPDGRPFWGGGYIPKRPPPGMSSFVQVLRRVADVFAAQGDGIAADATTIATALEEMSQPLPGAVTMARIDGAAKRLTTLVDPFLGGFGAVPKFPNTVALETMWRTYLRGGGQSFADLVTLTLKSMGRGAFNDHVGGGFFRYTTDPFWRQPHYEKMLDVNAALVRMLTEVWRHGGDPGHAAMVRRTVHFLLETLRLPGGAFAGSLDADSLDGAGAPADGAFYVWKRAAIDSALDDDAALFLDAYHVTEGKHLAGRGGPLYRTAKTPQDLADAHALSPTEVGRRLAAGLGVLEAARRHRAPPAMDDKVIAHWNGMAISALAEAGFALGEATWIDAARGAFQFITVKLVEDGRLRRSWHAGRIGPPAILDDVAAMAAAALTLFEVTGEVAYRRRAEALAMEAVRHHWDATGDGFFVTADDAAPLPVRQRTILDGPNPSATSVIIEVLIRLYHLGGDEALRQRAEDTAAAWGAVLEQPPLGAAGFINAAETLRAALQVVIIGGRGEAATDALVRRVGTMSLPTRILQVVAPGTALPEGHPAEGKGQEDGRATAYVCRGTFCSLPVTDAQDLARTLAEMRRRP